MKIKFLLKLISLSLCFIFCFSSIPTYAINTSYDGMTQYFAEKAYGKIFAGGVNQSVKDADQLDTQITNIRILNQENTYILKFSFNSSNITIPCNMVQAKANNVNGDHYLFSPIDFTSDTFNFVNISFTTSANNYDLLPVNSQFVGKTVLTIIFEEKSTSDIYYWQANLESNQKLRLKTDTIQTFNLSDTEEIIKKTNEYYYINESDAAAEISAEELVCDNPASIEEYEEYKAYTPISTMSSGETNNNPYLYLGVQDSTFKTATNSWRWLAAGPASNGTQLPIRYYAYSFTRYGETDLIYTHIMIVGYVWQADTSYTTYVAEDNKEYAKAGAVMKVELFKLPHTVIYNTITGKFKFMVGGERLTQIEEPSIQILKTSSNIQHLVVGRYEFSNATKKGGFLGLGSLVLSEVLVGLLDLKTYGIASTLVNITSIISNASKSVGAEDGYVPVEVYYSSYDTQVIRYGNAIGSVKSKVKGYLREEGQHFGLRVWFATPYANRSQVTSVMGIYYVSPSMR